MASSNYHPANNSVAAQETRNQRYHEPASVEELTEQNVRAIVQLDEAAKEKRTTLDRFVDNITDFCGNMTFVWFHIAWFGMWIGLNTIAHFIPGLHQLKPFDAFPFSFLTLAVSLEAIFLSAFILISQNRQMALSERRNHLDLQINLLTEQENTKMLALLVKIAQKVGADIDDDPNIRILEEATRPDKLIEQIERSINQIPEPKKSTST